MATPQQLRDLLHAQPFRPFDLVLVDGTTLTVRHPDFVSIPPVRRPREIEYYVVLDEDEQYQRRFIDLNLVLEVVAPSDETLPRPRPPRPPSPGTAPATS